MRKISATKVFDGYTLYQEPMVVIVEDNGKVMDILAIKDAGDDVEMHEGILSPGFINCHVHLELSHLKGLIPENTGLVDFVTMILKRRQAPEEIIAYAIEKAEDEMLANGIVAAGDICNTPYTIAQKHKERIWYHNFIEASGYVNEKAPHRFDEFKKIFAAFGQLYHIPIASNSIVPHAPYSVSDVLWELIQSFPGNHLLSIHNQESSDENEWFISKQGRLRELYELLKIDVSDITPTGKSSICSYIDKWLPNQQFILVHNVHTDQADIDAVKAKPNKVFWCLCPNANWYIQRNLPDIDLLIKNECAIVLGTDSLASNHRLSILSEIKTLQQTFPNIPLYAWLMFATSSGAKALEVYDRYGSFTQGKYPGVLLISEDLEQVKRLA